MKLIAYLLLALSALPVKAQTAGHHPRNTKALVPAVVQAVEDEIYDLGHEKLYFLIDDNKGGDKSPAKISLYVSKTLSPNGTGVVLYKDMPYGQVYRYFDVEKNGLVHLSGDPTGGFPPTGGSMLTIYMTDEQVCAFIHKSYKSFFVVDPDVSQKRLHEAEERQIERTGYSFRLKGSK